jgi:hypothetical protein
LVLAVGGWGALRQARILDSAAIYVTVPDLRAMAWIEAHLPQEARFVVNSQLANGESTVVGTDGGWWLPLLAGRQNTTPPLLYTTEKPPYPDYIREVQTIHELVHAADLSVEQLAKEMAARNLDYVYIGQRRGRVGAGNEIPLEPARFAASEAFELVYAEDGVRILRIASMAP